MTTEEIVKKLKAHEMSAMGDAADRLEELERDVIRLRRVTTRPEPSRLEIAAQLLCVYVEEKILNGNDCIDESLVQAQKLIDENRKLS